MIVSAPTALYNAVLPESPQDDTPVTWTISSQNPPRSQQTLFQLLRTEQLRRIPGPVIDDQQRRETFGELIFRVTTSNATKAGSGAKSFEIGQLLEFDDVQQPTNVATLNVPSVVELQQNLNVLDLDALGLSESEKKLFEDNAQLVFKDKLERLNDLITDVKNTRSEIAGNQKLLNETSKAIDAAEVVFEDATGSESGQQIISGLESRRKQLQDQRDTLVDDLNNLITEANEIYNEILDVREVVR